MLRLGWILSALVASQCALSVSNHANAEVIYESDAGPIPLQSTLDFPIDAIAVPQPPMSPSSEQQMPGPNAIIPTAQVAGVEDQTGVVFDEATLEKSSTATNEEPVNEAADASSGTVFDPTLVVVPDESSTAETAPADLETESSTADAAPTDLETESSTADAVTTDAATESSTANSAPIDTATESSTSEPLPADAATESSTAEAAPAEPETVSSTAEATEESASSSTGSVLDFDIDQDTVSSSSTGIAVFPDESNSDSSSATEAATESSTADSPFSSLVAALLSSSSSTATSDSQSESSSSGSSSGSSLPIEQITSSTTSSPSSSSAPSSSSYSSSASSSSIIASSSSSIPSSSSSSSSTAAPSSSSSSSSSSMQYTRSSSSSSSSMRSSSSSSTGMTNSMVSSSSSTAAGEEPVVYTETALLFTPADPVLKYTATVNVNWFGTPDNRSELKFVLCKAPGFQPRYASQFKIISAPTQYNPNSLLKYTVICPPESATVGKCQFQPGPDGCLRGSVIGNFPFDASATEARLEITSNPPASSVFRLNLL